MIDCPVCEKPRPLRARKRKNDLICRDCRFRTRKMPARIQEMEPGKPRERALQNFARRERTARSKERNAARCPNCGEKVFFGIRPHLGHPKKIQDVGCAICGFRTETFEHGEHDYDLRRFAVKQLELQLRNRSARIAIQHIRRTRLDQRGEGPDEKDGQKKEREEGNRLPSRS